MVAPKITGGGYVKGALQYDFDGRPGEQRTPPGEWVGGSCVGSDAAELLAQFKPILALRPEAKKPVWRCSINLHPSDGRLTDAEWDKISRRFLVLMGIDPGKVAWCGIHHVEKQHDHIHITLSRVLPDGSLWDRAHDVKRAIEACAQIERESPQLIGRQLHQHDRTPKDKRSLSVGERCMKQKGLPVIRELLQEKVDKVLADHPQGIGLQEFVAELQMVGVEARPYLPKGKFAGMSYSAEGISFPGGKLGSKYTNTGLLERGVRYQEGDGAPTESVGVDVPTPAPSEQKPTVTPEQAALARQALDKARAGTKKQIDEAHQAGVSEHLIRMALAMALMMARLIETLFRLPKGTLGSWEYTPQAGVRAVPPAPSEGADLAALTRAQAKLAVQLNKLTEALQSGDMDKLPKLEDERFKKLREQFAEANRHAAGHDQDDEVERQARQRALREGGRP